MNRSSIRGVTLVTGNRIKINVVSMKQPCTACLITGNLLKEILAKLQKEQPWIELEFIELDNLKQVGMVPGLEVEKLPALLINNEQVTAGSLPSKKQIITWIASEGGNNVEYNK
ncbi:MAG TPA: hypothetical protein DDW65_11825 [Firmicutes bacterium]|jgi:hypothetical protein|nr:hypothetical protein [Bacillota bacterium]